VHSFGLLDGNLKVSTVVFDEDGFIHIVDFWMSRLSGCEANNCRREMFMDEGWWSGAVNGITSFPLEIVVFISEIIREELSSNSGSKKSFLDTFDILQFNKVQIVHGFDSAEVS
jgi:hypothetical protein